MDKNNIRLMVVLTPINNMINDMSYLDICRTLMDCLGLHDENYGLELATEDRIILVYNKELGYDDFYNVCINENDNEEINDVSIDIDELIKLKCDIDIWLPILRTKLGCNSKIVISTIKDKKDDFLYARSILGKL